MSNVAHFSLGDNFLKLFKKLFLCFGVNLPKPDTDKLPKYCSD